MNGKIFFKEFIPIENYLFNLAGNFDRRQGFLNLLQHFQTNKLLPKDVLADLDSVWQIRNKIISSPSGERIISDKTSNTIMELKHKFGL